MMNEHKDQRHALYYVRGVSVYIIIDLYLFL